MFLRNPFRKIDDGTPEKEPLIEEEQFKPRRKPVLKLFGILCVLATCVIIICVVIWTSYRCSTPGISIGMSYNTLDGQYKHAAVVTNAPPCATIGRKILKRGGKAVDAMIGAMLCDGLTCPQSMGIGGGFFMVIYDKKNRKISTINARETAPAAASKNMFYENEKKSEIGGLAVAVPGEIKGYWTAYQKFGGGISWKEIFLPIISMCEEGIPINQKLRDTLVLYEKEIKLNPEFRKLFVNFSTGALLEQGDKYKNLKLAKTLRTIAENGGDVFYKGQLASDLANDIQKEGGIITVDDLNNYAVDMSEPLVAPIFKDYKLHTLVPPSSGVVLAYILRLLNGIIPAPSEIQYTQRVTEAFKFGYGVRSELGDHRFATNVTQILENVLDDEYIRKTRGKISDTSTSNDPTFYGGQFENNNDHGTANLAVLHENGDAVVATSTINLHFGSRVISNSTGIILNNEMNDFSLPHSSNYFGLAASPENYIEPGKRPMSSMCPSIILDSQGDVKMLVGAAGGTKITTSVAVTILRTLVMHETVRSAIDHVSFHHQLSPMIWEYYVNSSQEIVEGMKKIGHQVKEIAPTSFAAVTAIHRANGTIFGSCDRKREGQVDGY